MGRLRYGFWVPCGVGMVHPGRLARWVPRVRGWSETVTHRQPQNILDEIAALDAESAKVLKTIRGLI